MSRIKGDALTNPPRFTSWRTYRASFGETARDTLALGMADVHLTNFEVARLDRLDAQKLTNDAVAEVVALRKKLKKIKRILRGPKVQTEKSPG